jgi:GMP synthase (glutamine-hydrolysing)
MNAHQKVLIVDFGSQVTQLIARRLREANVFCEIHPFEKAGAALAAMAPQAIILSGGPASTTEAESPRADPALFAAGVPILGICYGEQAICAQLGGKVESGHHREFGRAEIVITRDSPLFAGIGAGSPPFPRASR